MNKVSKKPLKSSRQKDKKLSKKVKNLTKQGILEGVNYFDSNDILNVENKDILNDKESEKFDGTHMDVENIENNNCPIIEKGSAHNAVILNLPFDAAPEELSNFLSKRGIPVDAISIENGKYAVIESNDSESYQKIVNILATKPLLNTKGMTASKLTGNFQKLETLCQRNSILNRSIITVKNINSQTNINDILNLIPNDKEVKKHQFTKLFNRKSKTRIAIIEFISPLETDDVVNALNGALVDGNKLVAEFKHKLVDEINENKVFTLRIGNLPETSNYETIKNFEFNCTKMHLTKKSGTRICFITFKSNKDLTEAYQFLLNKEIDGNKITVKLVEFKTEKTDSNADRTKLHITNLPYTCTKEDMEKEFEMASSLKFPLNINGKSKGCCYLSFESEELAALAMEGFKDKIINGRKIRCDYAKINQDFTEYIEKTKKERRPKQKLEGNVITLFNLPKTVTIEQIKLKFEHVKFIHIIKKDNIFKGIAEVHFIKPNFAKAAIDAPTFSMGGREIRKELKGGKWRDRVERTSKSKPKSKKEISEVEESDE